MAKATRLPLEKGWNDFVRWCRARGLRPLPAHPWTVGAYVRWCEPRKTYADIVAGLQAIARRHLHRRLRVPDRHPTVRRTLELIERRLAVRGAASNLFRDEDFLAEQASTQEEPAGKDTGEARRRKKRPGRAASRPLRQAPPLVRRRPS